MESSDLDSLDTSYTGPSNPEVGRVGWSNDTVWLDAAKTNAREGHHATVPGTIGIQGVSEEVWNFHIGGELDPMEPPLRARPHGTHTAEVVVQRILNTYSWTLLVFVRRIG